MGDSEDRVYYGVYIPSVDDTVECHVVSDKIELTSVLKSNKKARFKQFPTEKDAREFTFKILKTGECPASQPMYESSPFKSLSPQEMVELRKAIERHDMARVKVMVNENPRYLISSGDTPSILQVGSRYNALHISARYNCPEACSFILECVSSVRFMRRLYNGSSSDLHERCRILMDLYLNTPDKGVNETPLHFASKYGAIEVVKILVSYDQCHTDRLNKYGKTAREIVCSRPTGSSEDSNEKTRDAIIKALDQRYYVGVLRSPDGCVQPTVVEPFTLHNKSEVEQSSDSLSSPCHVSGMAGPMTFEEATVFRKKWKTPPRKLNFSPSLVRSSVFDPEKGIERIGRNLASEIQIPWKEYWSFLDAFADLTNSEGLSLLEKYLKTKVEEKVAQNARQIQSDFFDSPPLNGQDDDYFEDASEEFSSPLFNIGENASGSVHEVLSPISALCHDFCSALKITDGLSIQSIEDSKTKTDPFFIPLFSFNSMCTVWTTKIGSAIPNGAGPVLRQVNNFQNYLGSCLGDRRFKSTPFSIAHAIVGKSIREKLESLALSNGVLRTILKDIEERETDESVRNAALCILNFIKSDSDNLESCNCRLNPKTSQGRNRRLDFDSDYDSDDSNLEYFTPPSTPPNELVNDSTFEEIDTQLALPPVYLVGDEPTKIDRAVLDAIASVDIDPKSYPRIHAWKIQCEQSRESNETGAWDSPARELLVMRSPNPDMRTETHSWHRNLF